MTLLLRVGSLKGASSLIINSEYDVSHLASRENSVQYQFPHNVQQVLAATKVLKAVSNSYSFDRKAQHLSE